MRYRYQIFEPLKDGMERWLGVTVYAEDAKAVAQQHEAAYVLYDEQVVYSKGMNVAPVN